MHRTTKDVTRFVINKCSKVQLYYKFKIQSHIVDVIGDVSNYSSTRDNY